MSPKNGDVHIPLNCVFFFGRHPRLPTRPGKEKMNYRNSYNGIDPELVKIVKKAAKRAIGKAGFTRSDLPDIEQELMLAALDALKSMRHGADSKNAFIFRVASNQLKSILRSRRGKSKEHHASYLSLNILIGIDEGEYDELISLIDDDHLLREDFCRWNERHLDIDLIENLNEAISGLSENLREFCEELKKKPLKQLRRERKISLKTVRRNLARIREELKKRELFF